MFMEVFCRYFWIVIRVSRINMVYLIIECIWLIIWKDEIRIFFYVFLYNDN